MVSGIVWLECTECNEVMKHSVMVMQFLSPIALMIDRIVSLRTALSSLLGAQAYFQNLSQSFLTS